MKILIGFLSLSLLFIIGCPKPCYYVSRPSGAQVCLPYCRPLIKYQGNSFTIKGLTIPIPLENTTVTIGEVSWDTKTLQDAATVSQILDLKRISRCENLPLIVTSMTDEKQYQKILIEMYNDEIKITHLALFLQANDPKMVKKWLDSYAQPVMPDKAPVEIKGLIGTIIEKRRGTKVGTIYIPNNAPPRPLSSFFD